MVDKFEVIEWLDHSSWESSSWHHFDDLRELSAFSVVSVGQVIDEDKSRVILAAHVARDVEKACGELCILKPNIISRKKLVEKRGR